MKSKVPAIILAIGISASPVFAKNANRRAVAKDPSKVEEQKLSQKRAQNSYFRQKKIELEKEFLRETEEEIQSVLTYEYDEFLNDGASEKKQFELREIIMKDDIPLNGIDISQEFQKIKSKT